MPRFSSREHGCNLFNLTPSHPCGVIRLGCGIFLSDFGLPETFIDRETMTVNESSRCRATSC